MRRLVTVAVAMTVTMAASSCGLLGGGDDVDGSDANAALEQQRLDVRQAAAELLKGAEQRLPGSVTSSSGTWRGCESAFNDEFKNFQYTASGRVDAGSDAARPYLDALRAVLEQAGFSVDGISGRPGGKTLAGTKDELSASFSELPDQGSYVLVGVSGPCIDVAKEDREKWLRKEEPTPDLLQP